MAYPVAIGLQHLDVVCKAQSVHFLCCGMQPIFVATMLFALAGKQEASSSNFLQAFHLP